jgi:hypothetical protein
MMKALWWLVALFAIATLAREGYDYFGPMARAYRAYVDEARKDTLSRPKGAGIQEIEGSIVEVLYRLESADRGDDGSVHLVVVEAIHLQKFSESGPFGNRRVAETRQHVEMREIEDRWVTTGLREEATQVKDLRDAAEGGR